MTRKTVAGWIFFLCLSLSSTAQHAIVTQKGDTLRADYIHIDRETDMVEFRSPLYPDSLLTIPYAQVKDLLYRFYPKYENMENPVWIVNMGFGIHFANYTPGYGNLDSQPILKDEISRGAHYSAGVSFMNKKRVGVSFYTGLNYSYSDRDSLWAREKFFTSGLGVAWLSANIDHDLFFSARVMPTFISYYAEGKILNLSYNHRDNLVGFFSEIGIDLHITQNLSIQFSGNAHLFHRNPGTDKKVSLTLGTMGINCGFTVFL